MVDDLAYFDASALAEHIRRGELSPVEILRGLRDRADLLNPRLNAIVTWIGDAEDRAREAEAAVLRGDELGALHGVPFTIKDSFDTAGVRTTRGSRLFADHVPGLDATVVARLKAAGAIALAKTNLPDSAFWWETDNLLFGRTVNPWDAERSAGGSSGGEAAAVAAGLSPLGVGSDLGGSIRLPAHYCGVVGLKPTHGRIPVTGHWPAVLLGFLHAGFLARSVRDVALALSLTSGPDGEDWHALPVAPPAVPTAVGPALRVGVLAETIFPAIDPEVVSTVARAAAALRELGWATEPGEVPSLEQLDWNEVTMTLYSVAGRSYWEEATAGRRAELHPALQRRLSIQPDSLEEYVRAEHAVEALNRDLTAFFHDHDLLLCPTVPLTAHPHDAAELVIAGTSVPPRAAMRATIPWDLTGSPALSVPFGWSADGLPIGVQLIGRRFDEETVLRAGLALEQARGPLRHPPL